MLPRFFFDALVRAFPVCALSLGALTRSDAHAADAPADATLDTVNVTAARGTKLEDLDISTTVLRREQVEASPATTVDQVVNKIPGVYTPNAPTGQLHPTGQPFNIRGFGTSTTINTLVLVDGVPANDPYFRTVDWNGIAKASVDRIEVIRGGGATSLWGNLAAGGIVSIVTREPAPDARNIDVSYGSFDTSNGDVAATLFADEAAAIGLEYGHAQSNGYNATPSPYRNPKMDSPSSRADNAILSAILRPWSGGRAFVRAYWHDGREDGLTWATAHNRWANERLVVGGNQRVDDRTAIDFNAWVGDGKFGTTNVSVPGYTLTTPNVGVPYASQNETAKYRNDGGSLVWTADYGRVRDVKIGADARKIHVSDGDDFFTAAGVRTNFLAEGKHRLEGVFAQGTWSPVDPLDITAGLRSDFFQATDARIQGRVNSALDLRVPDSATHQLDPRLGFKLEVTDALALRGAAYRNFAAPGMNQMYRSFVSGTGYTAPSPDLKPQDNRGIEGGIDWRRDGVSVSANYYDNKLNGFIDFATICSTAAVCAPLVAGSGVSGITTVRQYVNAGRAVFRGAELIGEWIVNDRLSLSGGATETKAYLVTTNNPGADPLHVQIGQVPRWTVNLGATVVPLAGLSVTATAKSFPAYWNNTGHTQRDDRATLVDLGVIYRLTKAVELYAYAQNVGNKHYLDQGLTTTTFEGATVNTTAIPALGLPATVNAGVRARF